MICNNCGNNLEANEKFCGVCGAVAPRNTMNGTGTLPSHTYFRQRERGMFSYIGKKIKDLATVLTLGGVIFGIIGGLVCIGMGMRMNLQAEGEGVIFILAGAAIMMIVPLLSWLGSYLLYGYGELVDKTSEISNDLKQLLIQNMGKNKNEG